MTEEMLWHASAAGRCVQRALKWDPFRQSLLRRIANVLSLALFGALGAGMSIYVFSGGFYVSTGSFAVVTLIVLFIAKCQYTDLKSTPRISDGCVVEVSERWYGPMPLSSKLLDNPELEILPPGEHEITVGDGRIVWTWPNGRVWGHAFGWWTRTIIAGDFLIATRAEDGVQEYICFQVPLSVIGDESDIRRLRELLTNRHASRMAVPQSEQ